MSYLNQNSGNIGNNQNFNNNNNNSRNIISNPNTFNTSNINNRQLSEGALPFLSDEKQQQSQNRGDRDRDFNRNSDKQQRLLNNFNNLTNLNPNLNPNLNLNLNIPNPNSRINSGTNNNSKDHIPSSNEQRVRLNSRQREEQNNNNNNFDDQFKQVNFHSRDQDSLYQEINGFKKLLKYIMESQTEMQKKIIDYNKYITEQENITRLNNLKINEHDSKLTEILITFNNYLKLNDNSTTIINNLTKNYENSVKKVELNEVKANLSEVSKNSDLRFGEFSIKYDHLLNKYSELSKEQEVFQKYTLEKLKIYQNENIENKIQQQQSLIKLEDARDQKFNHQFDQIKLMVSTSEKNLVTEAMIRKSAHDGLKEEVVSYLRNFDEKMSLMEKNNLETERKTINFSKDYITGMKDLMTQNNQKTDIELQALKSLIDTNVNKIEIKVDEERKKNQNLIVEMKSLGLEKENKTNELESWIKENFETIDNKAQANSNELKNLQELTDKLTTTIKALLEEKSADSDKKSGAGSGGRGNKDAGSSVPAEFIQIKKEFADIRNEIVQFTDTVTKKLIDEKERFDLFKKEFTTLEKALEDKIKLEFDEQNEKLEDQKTSLLERLKVIKVENEDFRKKQIGGIDEQIEMANRKVREEQNELFDRLTKSIEDKVNILHRDLNKDKKEENIIIGGQLQGYFILTYIYFIYS